jgi:saccharopine dehydrogenase (NAD+, L-glutamate forming)
MVLNNEIKLKGVKIPIENSIYKPILKELDNFGITFNEKDVNYLGYNSLNT